MPGGKWQGRRVVVSKTGVGRVEYGGEITKEETHLSHIRKKYYL